MFWRTHLPCFLFMALFVAPGARAHRLEPISTQFARPFEPRTGSLEINYEYERRARERIRTHLIPIAEFELGITRRVQFSVEMPLIRQKSGDDPALVGGGHLEIGFRYLLVGGPFRSYAVSINSFVAAPTGNPRLAGDATEAGVALHFDKEFGERAFLHGNYGWSTTIGGSEQRERRFHYKSALVVPLTLRWNPAIELLGETDTATGRTELGIQPEMIYYVSPHWELKLGVPLGLTRSSPGIGVRAQVTWIFGRGGSK